MKKVLVTGAGGFVGRHSLKTLVERGFEVHAVASKTLPTVNSDCIWHLANLLDHTSIKELVGQVKPTHLLHFAWCYTVPGQYWKSQDNFLWVQASLELLRQFREQGGDRVVIGGTCAEYDWKYGYCSELVTPLNPDTPYGICKNALQEIVSCYCETTSLSSAWGRIFFPYGAYEYPNRLVSSVILSLLKGEPARCSHGNQIRDFMYVQDVADAFVALLESEVTGSVNIGSGQAIAIKDVVYQIAHLIGRSDLVQLGAIASAAKEAPLLVADVSRLSHEVGYFSQFDLETGLRESVNWWKKTLFPSVY